MNEETKRLKNEIAFYKDHLEYFEKGVKMCREQVSYREKKLAALTKCERRKE